MQLMPDTARQYGVRNSYDPKANLEAGVRHLKDLLSRLELPLALAAYNAGEATIKRYGGVPPYARPRTTSAASCGGLGSRPVRPARISSRLTPARWSSDIV
jgi:soluble lytic murein transglycosylase-like protein